MLRPFWRGIAAAAATAALAAAAPATAQEIDRVVISSGTDVVGLNAVDVVVLVPDRSLMDHISDTLMRWRGPGDLQPWLAKSLEIVDPVTWELKLRGGVKFHNGEPFNAEAVKFSYETILDEANKSPSRSNHSFVDHVEVIDDYTVRIITKEPVPLAPNLFTALHMMPPAYVKEVGVDGYRKKPIGTGPYKFVEHVRDSHVTLEANPDYWGGPQKIKTIVYRPIKEDAARVSALITGEVDLALRIPPELTPMVEASEGIKIKAVPSARSFVILFSNMNPDYPTNNVKVREAINYAIDRESLNANILGGTGAPAVWFNPTTFGFDTTMKPVPYDPEKAKQLLAEAGYPNGLELTFDSPNGQYVKDLEMSEAIAGQLAKVGIKVTVQPYEWGVYTKRIFSKQTAPMALIGWGDTNSDPHSHNRLVLHSAGSWNQLHVDEIDKVVEEIQTEMDSAKREALIKQEQMFLRQSWPVVYVVQMADLYGVSDKLDWWEPRSDEKVWLYQSNVTE